MSGPTPAERAAAKMGWTPACGESVWADIGHLSEQWYWGWVVVRGCKVYVGNTGQPEVRVRVKMVSGRHEMGVPLLDLTPRTQE